MIKTRFLFILLFLCLVYGQANAALFSGGYMLQLCERGEKGEEIVVGGHTACQAYIAGLIDYHQLLRSLGTSPSVDICVPDDANMNDIQDIVYEYLLKHEDSDGFIAAPAIALALFEHYPCEGSE